MGARTFPPTGKFVSSGPITLPVTGKSLARFQQPLMPSGKPAASV